MDVLPVPEHAGQEVVLWPWHFGHNNFWGIVILPRFQRNTKFPRSRLDHVGWSWRLLTVCAFGRTVLGDDSEKGE